jgi:glycine/D-amino acid oxidase-like deaminating enzyme
MRGSGRPIWDDLSPAADLAWLDHDDVELPASPDVLVIGGGVIGLAIGAFCALAGMDVLLVEKEQRLAGAASGRAAGGLSPDAHPELGPEWHAMAKRSLELHQELDDRWNYGLRTTDLLVLPDLVIPDQGHVNPLRFCAALARRVGTIATGVHDEQLRDVHPTFVVRATGGSGTWVKGHLVATAPVAPVLDTMVYGNDLLMLQLPSGHIVAGGTKEPNISGADVDEAVVQQICSSTSERCGELRVTHSWTCFRPLGETELPTIQRIGEHEWDASGFYSTGVLMAPVVGETVANAIANES